MSRWRATQTSRLVSMSTVLSLSTGGRVTRQAVRGMRQWDGTGSNSVSNASPCDMLVFRSTRCVAPIAVGNWRQRTRWRALESGANRALMLSGKRRWCQQQIISVRAVLCWLLEVSLMVSELEVVVGWVNDPSGDKP